MHEEMIETCKEAPLPISEKCLNRLQGLADRAIMVNDKVRSKLIPVTISTPAPGPCEAVKTAEAYPPLFDYMRSAMDVIEAALDGIDFACHDFLLTNRKEVIK